MLLITNKSSAICPKVCTCNFVPKTVNCSLLNLKEVPKEGNYKETYFLQIIAIIFDNLKRPERSDVETFDLSYNKLVRIGVDRFRKLNNLKELMLSHNEITEFYYGDSHAELTYIDLSHNLMGPALKGGSFKGLLSLKYLDLSFNNYKFINIDLFPTNIEILKLAYNKIKYVSCSEKFTVNNLYQLDLKGLDPETDKSRLSDTISKFIEMQRLSVSGAKKSKLKDNTFELMENLNKLELDDMAINEIPYKMFVNNRQLISLSLKNNSLQRIPNFSKLSILKDLSLDNNKISEIYKSDFIGYEKIKEISLSGNNIKTVFESSTKFLRDVEVLKLDGNELLYAKYSISLESGMFMDINFEFNTKCGRNFSKILSAIKKVSFNHVTCITNSIDSINCTGSVAATYMIGRVVSTLLKNSEQISSCATETVDLITQKNKNIKMVIIVVVCVAIVIFILVSGLLLYCKILWKKQKTKTIGYFNQRNMSESAIPVCNVLVNSELDRKEENEYGSVPTTSPIYESPESPVKYAFAQFEHAEGKIATSMDYNVAQDDGDRYAMASDEEAIERSNNDKQFYLMPLECSIGFDDCYEVDLGVYTEIGELAEKK